MKIWKVSVMPLVAMLLSIGGLAAQTVNAEMLQQAAAMGYSESEVVAQINAQQGSGSTTSVVTPAPTSHQGFRGSSVSSVEPSQIGQVGETSTFGQSLFRNENVSFEPNINIPTPTDYVLTAGDEVVITIWGDTELLYKEVISPDGIINVPNYGPVNLSGKSVDAAQKYMEQILSKSYNSLGSGSQLMLSVGKIRSIKVSVSGEFVNPGTYSVPSLANLLHLLHISGGTTSIGNMRSIELYRESKLVTTLDLYDYILKGDITSNAILKDGDVVIAKPYDVRVSVAGKVKRPMRFQLKAGETVTDLFSYVGGFNDDAYKQEVTIYRNNGVDREIIMAQLANFDVIELVDGDRIVVGEVNNEYKNIVSIEGALWRVGDFQYDEQTNNLRGLIEKAGGLMGNAFASRGIITRRNEDYTTSMINFVTADVVSGESNVELQNYDKVYIPLIEDLKEEYNIMIFGEVNNPQVLNFHEGMRIEDAIVLAGGLKESATLATLDVTRRVNDKNSLDYSDVIAESFNFQINEDLSLNESTADFTLKPFDVVVVRRSPQYESQVNVFVTGEVLFPGTHTVTTDNTYLSDVINMVNGLTPNAYIKGATMVRRTRTKSLSSELVNSSDYFTSDDVMIMAVNNLQGSTGERDTLVVSTSDFRTYMIGIDMEKALKKPHGPDDILLQSDDIIHIPKQSNIVNVVGAVYYPNATSFSTKKLKYYVESSGGYNRSAYRRPFVIYLNGKVATTKGLFRRKPKVEPGAIVVVPAKSNRSRASVAETISAMSSMTSLASSISTLGVAIGSM